MLPTSEIIDRVNRDAAPFAKKGRKRGDTVSEVTARNLRLSQLSALGFSNAQIAEHLGISPVTVCNNKKAPLTKAMISHLRDGMIEESQEIQDRIKKMLPKCLDVLKEVIEDEENSVNPALKVKTATHLLSVGGYGPMKSVNHVVSPGLSPEQLRLVQERAAQMQRIDSGDVVEGRLMEEGEVEEDV